MKDSKKKNGERHIAKFVFVGLLLYISIIFVLSYATNSNEEIQRPLPMGEKWVVYQSDSDTGETISWKNSLTNEIIRVEDGWEIYQSDKETKEPISWKNSLTDEMINQDTDTDPDPEPESKIKEISFTSKILNNFPLFGLFISDDIDSFNVNLEFVKIILLVISIVFIYAVFNYLEFPPSGFLRLILALILGVITNMLITTSELLAFMESYKAMSVAVVLMVPIILLSFITFILAMKFDSIGAIIQKSLWSLYSFYLFLKTATLLLLKFAIKDSGSVQNPRWHKLFEFLLGPDYLSVVELSGSTITLIVLLIASILVYFIFVLGNSRILDWIAREKINAEVFADLDEKARDRAARKVNAKSTREN
jgi:hypothetical protein